MKQLKYFLCLCLCFAFLSAQAAQDPVKFLQKTSDQMLQALKDNRPQLKKNPKIVFKIVNKILIPHVDTTAMSQQVLGRRVWSQLTHAKQKEFTKEFVNLVIRTYSSALSAYQDETVTFYPLRYGADKRPRIQVRSVINQQGGRRIPVNYWLLRRGQSWKVYDLSVEGISLLQSFRTQFAQEIAQGGFGAMMKSLKAHNRRMTDKALQNR